MTRVRIISFKKILLPGLPVMLVLLITASAYWLLHTASGAAWLWNKLEDVAAGAVHSADVGGDLASGFVVRNLEYRSDTVDLSVGRAEIQVGPGWWPVSVQVRALALQDIEIFIRSAGEPGRSVSGDTDIGSALAALDLAVPLKIHQAIFSSITLRTGEEQAGTHVESLRLRAVLDERLVIDQLELLAAGIEARLHGQLALEAPFELAVAVEGRIELGPADLRLPFRLESSGNPDSVQFSLVSLENGLQLRDESLELTISGSASPHGIQISNAVIVGSGVDLGFSGKLDWTSEPEAGLSAEIVQLDLSPWLQGWPAGEYLAGNIELNWSETGLEIPAGRLTLSGTGMALDIGADIDIEANTVNARLAWSNFSWPLAVARPDFTSPLGELNLSGSIDHWTSTGQLEIQLGDYPQGRFDIQGGGNRTSARLSILSGEVLGGSISGEAGADWTDDLVWDAALLTRGINPEPLLPGWPGRLDAEIKISAQSKPQRIQINLVSLQGLLRGVPLSARGGLGLEDNKLTFNGFELHTDEAELRLNGTMTDAAGVSVQFNGYLPSTLLQGASGSVALEGRYSSSPGQPLLDLQLEALDLAWNGFGIRSLAISTLENGMTGQVPAFQLSAAGLALQDVWLDELSLSFNPAGDQRGVLDVLEVAINEEFMFDLLEPAPLEWSAESVFLGPLCLRGSAGAGVCLDGDYQSTGDWSLAADITAVPFDYVRELLDLDVHFEQLIEGRLEWHQSHDKAPTGGAEIRITAGRILDIYDNELLAETSEGRFAFGLRNGNLESGVLDIEFPGTGFIDVDFEVLDIVGDGARTLQGRAVTQLDNIKLLGQLLLPAVDDIKGHFESNIQLGGSLDEPVFNGGFKFSDGLIQYDPIGLKLENIEFEGRVEKRDRGYLKGRFRAGEGIGSIDGRFLFDDVESMQIDIAFSGDQLLLINTDTLKIITETDLRIGLSPQRMEIDGHISVPSARLTPSNLLLGRVNDSEDLVIENQGDGLLPGADETAWKIMCTASWRCPSVTMC